MILIVDCAAPPTAGVSESVATRCGSNVNCFFVSLEVVVVVVAVVDAVFGFELVGFVFLCRTPHWLETLRMRKGLNFSLSFELRAILG